MDIGKFKETQPMPICWLFVAIILVTPGVTSAYQLSAPSNYTAFIGVIIVKYSIPQNITLKSGVIQLISTRTNKVVNNEGRMPAGYNNGEVTFRCGVVDHAGMFVFQMLETPGGPVLTESNIMYVKWPRFMMVLPETYEVLTDEVSLHFQIGAARCDSAHSGSTFWLQLVYYGMNVSWSSNDELPVPSAQVIKRQNFTTFTNIHNAELIFECRLFDRAGIYQMLFRAGPEQHDLVAYSNQMRVIPSNAYSLDSLSPSIYPCTTEIRIQYSQPKCSGNNDKVRLYKQIPQAESSIASPMNLIYVTEKRAQKHKASVVFECGLFVANVIGYCFVYMSTAQNGAVVEQKRVCLPTNNYSDSVVDGNWNTWSSWGVCSVTCGKGQRSRFRTCDHPKPANGGKFCVGDTVQWQNCVTPCKEVTSVSPEDIFISDDPTCQCGCDMTSVTGRIASSTRMCRGSVLWVITAPANFIIKLTFKIYALDGADRHTLVKVRDGDTRQSDLLVRDYGGSVPAAVTSSQNVMLVEFVMPVERRRMDLYEIDNQGLVAVYEAVASNTTVVAPPGGGLSTVWQSTVTLIGIVLCIIVIIAAVACAFHHRYTLRRRRRKKLQAHQALLSNGVGVGSPIHSIGSSSVNMSFSDPLSSPAKRSYILPGGARNAQPQVVGRRDAPILSPSGSSRKYLARDVANVDGMQYPNPYTLGTTGNDYALNPNLTPLDGHKAKGRRHHRHGHKKQSHNLDDQYSHRSKHDTDSTTRGYSRSSPHHKPTDFRSPNARSTVSQGSLSPTRLDPRNKSFMSAINQHGHIPMADAEDLSPEATSVGESRRGSHRQLDMMQISNEDIPLEPLYDQQIRRKKHKGNVADTCLGIDSSATEQRPPVEGRDSWPRKDPHPDDPMRNRHSQHLNDTKPVPTMLDTQNANYVPLSKRPEVRPLPLRSIQKPDGQSPENQYVTDRNANANTPSSLSSGLSPVLQKTKLFSDTSGSRSPSVLFQDPDLEYDDIPEIPGSYFTMDPHAYTLTWSGKQGGPGTPSKHLAMTGEERNTSNC